MITAKLYTYTQDEVDILRDLVNMSYEYFMDGIVENCYKYPFCDECPFKHICTDLKQLELFLGNEKISGYKHIAKCNRKK